MRRYLVSKADNKMPTIVEDDNIIKAVVDNWVRKWVFKLGLCPWSGKVLVDDKMRLVVQRGHPHVDADLENIRKVVLKESYALSSKVKQSNKSDIGHNNCDVTINKAETTIIIVPDIDNFQDYLDLHEYLEYLLEEEQLTDDIQIATFHPKYQFANTKKSDVENYTNRSPYAMFHLLKVPQVTEAIQAVNGDTDSVWQKNIETMKILGKKKVLELQKEIIQEVTKRD